MMATGLNGRVARLERVIAPPPAGQCRACGLRHVRPLTMDLVRRIVGPVSLMAPALQHEVAGTRRRSSACATRAAALRVTAGSRSGRMGWTCSSDGGVLAAGYSPTAAAAFPRNRLPSRMYRRATTTLRAGSGP